MLRINSTNHSPLVSTPEFLMACKVKITLFHWCYSRHLQIHVLFKTVVLGVDANLQLGFMFEELRELFEELWVFWRLHSSIAVSNSPHTHHKGLLHN